MFNTKLRAVSNNLPTGDLLFQILSHVEQRVGRRYALHKGTFINLFFVIILLLNN
jgi:hypothetical protein